MILLEQQCVSLELAKRLKELGVKQESVWGWMQESVSKQYWLGLSDDKKTFAVASAFTVSELGEMLPECYITERRLKCLHGRFLSARPAIKKMSQPRSICRFET